MTSWERLSFAIFLETMWNRYWQEGNRWPLTRQYFAESPFIAAPWINQRNGHPLYV